MLGFVRAKFELFLPIEAFCAVFVVHLDTCADRALPGELRASAHTGGSPGDCGCGWLLAGECRDAAPGDGYTQLNGDNADARHNGDDWAGNANSDCVADGGEGAYDHAVSTLHTRAE